MAEVVMTMSMKEVKDEAILQYLKRQGFKLADVEDAFVMKAPARSKGGPREPSFVVRIVADPDAPKATDLTPEKEIEHLKERVEYLEGEVGLLTLTQRAATQSTAGTLVAPATPAAPVRRRDPGRKKDNLVQEDLSNVPLSSSMFPSGVPLTDLQEAAAAEETEMDMLSNAMESMPGESGDRPPKRRPVER